MMAPILIGKKITYVFVLIGLSGIPAIPLYAGTGTLFTCQTQKECIEQDCNSTDFGLSIEKSSDSADPFQLITPAETIDGVFIDTNDSALATHMVARQTGAYHLLTVQNDGALKWSIHMPEAELAITYFGTCEGSK